MAVRTKTQFKALYGSFGTLFPDNTSGEISEADVRAFGEDIADSFVDESTTTAPTLTSVLTEDNDAGGLQLKNIADGTDPQDAVSKAQLDAVAGGGGTSIPFGSTSGTNTYTIAATPAVTAYTDGMLLHVKVVNGSTNVSTFNFDSVGAKKAYLTPDTQITVGMLVSNHEYIFTYDSALDSAAGGFLLVGDYNHGLLNSRTNSFDASGGAYPSTLGSGPAGAIKHFDAFMVSVAGQMPGGGPFVKARDWLIALADTPGNTPANWGYIINQKLYQATGTGVDGSMDQNSVTNALALKAPLASPALTGTPTAPTASANDNSTKVATTAYADAKVADAINDGTTAIAPSQNAVFDALALKVDKETFATLTFASPTNWDQNNRQYPEASVTATGNFTINMTNVKSGAQGVLRIISGTASTITLTFDTDFTNKDLITGATLTTYTFPANNGFEYLNTFVVIGTTIYWVIGDYLSPAIANPWARVSRAATQVCGNNDLTVPVSWDTESTDNANIVDIATAPTKFSIAGSGNKIATVSVDVDYAASATGVRRIYGYLNGAAAPGAYAAKNGESASISTTVVATWQIECAGGDYIEIIPYQNSGGNLNITAKGRIKIESR